LSKGLGHLGALRLTSTERDERPNSYNTRPKREDMLWQLLAQN
jgi:hypothetical protein